MTNPIKPAKDESTGTGAALAPPSFADELNKLTSNVLPLFPSGIGELSLEYTAVGTQLKLHVRTSELAGARPPFQEPRAPEVEVEGTDAFRLKWNISGHRVIAMVAADILADDFPAIKAVVDDIRHNDPNPARQEKGELADYAAWPDVNKSDAAFKQRTGKWHYIDIPFDGVSDVLADFPDGPHVLSAMSEQLKLLKDSTDPEERADALAFVVHFVGDIHQPLHCIELQNDEFPNGDAGGNKFELAHGKNMHSMWDGFVASNSANIATSAGQLKQKHPRSKFAARLQQTDLKEWVLESHRIGREAYLEIMAEPKEERASDAYRDWGRRVSREQAALAAYRLADLLAATLG